jgi:hypothetical protein
MFKRHIDNQNIEMDKMRGEIASLRAQIDKLEKPVKDKK